MGRVGAVAATLALALLLGACTSDEGGGLAHVAVPGGGDAPGTAADESPSPLIDPRQLVRGGPPPDGIPPLDRPRFQPAAEADWLAGDEPVLSLTVAGESRAYPLQIMTWHEIVNDTVGGVPVAVTYCPLCNSGVAFEREVDGRLLDFGTSGLLYADNLVMYDRQTRSLWPQLTGIASVGELTGTRLTAVPMGVIGFDQFRDSRPGALVLTRETGHDRPYGQNPYTDYDDPDGGLLFALPDGEDPRLPVKERVVGIELGGEAVAVRRSDVAAAAVVELSVGGRDLVVWHRPGQRSALDSRSIADARDIGTVAVLDRRVRGRTLSFEPDGRGFRDRRTGSGWNVAGHATDGPLAGARLREVTHLDTFWFAWVAFRPATTLHRG